MSRSGTDVAAVSRARVLSSCNQMGARQVLALGQWNQ